MPMFKKKKKKRQKKKQPKSTDNPTETKPNSWDGTEAGQTMRQRSQAAPLPDGSIHNS